ncbi:DinB family protein [Flavobacterium sp. CHNK8]|uniref:DinB family protein n=1 Tax=Flavobacterium sp. CHNK8 TaxID=2871165 RepID=UPI001C8D7347|nr:DinB family protein [Flavobacterium sp. CHNK8]QZK90087.1 DinB family protein [Flavobacterium sp. CHNK8]
MVEQSIKRLEYLTDIIPSLITEMGEESFSLKISKDKWSKKEIIGHLIDSATNNHQRFVRGQFEITPEIIYNQNKWNEFSFYQQINAEQIISFWTIYNKQLLEIIKRIPIDNLKREIKIGENIFTLKFLIADYVDHLEHHLKQIVEYE